MLDTVFSIETLLLLLVMYGLAPRAVLRFVVLALHHDDPRRSELLAEFYAVPRVERPFWVVEQIEVAIAEGLWPRLVWAASGRIIYRWRLRSALKAHQDHPDTFWIPSDEEKTRIKPGAAVKLTFEVPKLVGERMWVHVTDVKNSSLAGRLVSEPVRIPRLHSGELIEFKADHILDILWEGDDVYGGEPQPLCPCCAATWNDPEQPREQDG